MSDQLLQAIEERLAERRRASLGTMTDERREKALISLVQRARNDDGDGKERLEKLLALFPQLADWVAEQMALSEPDIVAPNNSNNSKAALQLLPEPDIVRLESAREMTRRQARAAGDAPVTPPPEPPKQWYENGGRPGLTIANRLKTLWGPKRESGDGGWMRNR
jgi:hypothetical protein